jgi:hypothetical protein
MDNQYSLPRHLIADFAVPSLSTLSPLCFAVSVKSPTLTLLHLRSLNSHLLCFGSISFFLLSIPSSLSNAHISFISNLMI